MNWRERLGLFVLTREEQRTIAFIILALVLGLATMHYRHTHQKGETPNEAKSTPFASASPTVENEKRP
jgi:hypothetical protein